MKILNTILRFIFKQKKFAVFFLSALIIMGILLPHTSLAFNENISAKNICQSKKNIFLQSGPELINLVIGSTVGCFDYYLAYTIAWIGSGIVAINHALANVSSSLFKVSLGVTSYGITRTDTPLGKIFYDAWSQVRNWANILVVLGFIGVALAFMMNLEQYKKLLAPLLLVAVLLNFSVVFVGLIIDASNIITNSFVQGAGNNGDLIFDINRTWNKTLYSFPVNSVSDSLVYLGLSIIMSIAYFMIALAFFALAIIFIQRFVFLAILFIFSPLAFVFYVFPLSSTKKLFSMWWEHLIKWAFVGIIGLFFLNLTSKIVAASGKIYEFNNIQDKEKIMAQLGTIFVHLLIVLIFLYIAIKMTFKASKFVSGIVIGGVMALAAGAGFAIGGIAGAQVGARLGKGDIKGAGTALKEGVGGALGLAGGAASRAFNATKLQATRGLERIRLLPAGSANAMRQRRATLTKKEQERVDNMTPEQLLSHTRGAAIRLGVPIESAMRIRAATIKKSFEAGILKNLPQSEQERYARDAIATDKNHATTIAKANPLLAHLDPDKMAELQIKYPEKSESEHATMAHKEAYARMPEDKELLKLNDQEKIERIIASAGGIETTGPNAGQLRGNVGAPEAQLIEDLAENGKLGKLAKALKDLGASGDGIEEVAKQMNGMADHLGSTVFKDAKAKAPQFADYDRQAIEERAQSIAGTGIAINATHINTARQQLRDEAHGRFGAYQIAAELDESSITKDFVLNKNITAQKISKAGEHERMTENKIRKFKALLPDLVKDLDNAYNAGDNALFDEIATKIEVIDSM